MSTFSDYQPPFNPDLLTLSQAAEYLALPRADLLALIRERRIRYIQRGIRVRVHREELDRYRSEAG
jgi:excisionase family DNA binding protein